MNRIDFDRMKKPIEGYEGRYLITSYGEVWSLISNKELKTSIINSGYESITLANSKGEIKHHLIHRLVAKAFCKGYKEGLDVNHKNANRLDNHYENLEWVTRKQNIQDAVRRGTNSIANARTFIRNEKSVIQYTKDWEIIAEHNSIKEASEFSGAHAQHIGKVSKGERNFAGGFRWQFK